MRGQKTEDRRQKTTLSSSVLVPRRPSSSFQSLGRTEQFQSLGRTEQFQSLGKLQWFQSLSGEIVSLLFLQWFQSLSVELVVPVT